MAKLDKLDTIKEDAENDFIRWLKQDELFEYYNANPDQQEAIYKHYQREKENIQPKNFDYWFDWAVNNLEAAEKEYPAMFALMKEAAKEAPPYFTAAIIEKTPEHFSKWKSDIENCLPATRKKKIEQYIELIELLLYQLEFASDIENNAVTKIRPELLEMEQYFKGLLSIDGQSLIWWKKPKTKLKTLMNELQSKGYTDSNSLANFMDENQKPFNANTTHKPIWWKKSGRLLKYLMDELARLEYIDRESPVNKHIKEHFIDKNKNPFTDSIKQNSSGAGLNRSGKPKGHKEIDNLINSLKDQPDQSE